MTGASLPPAAPLLGGIAPPGGAIERATARRADSAWLAAAWADERTRVLVVEDGQALVRAGKGTAELVFVPPREAPGGPSFLLGVDADGVAYFGVGAPPGSVTPTGGGEPGGDGRTVRRAGLRDAGALLAGREAALLTQAVALANWHATATHCPRCGAVTVPEMAGHARRCTADGSEHFPRTDPAVIMLVTDPRDRCLLARNARWPPRRVSVLAGFVEPGESAEQAVAREVREEAGIVVDRVTYAGSQPWPMPHSLMLGFRAQAAQTAITVDAHEIAEAAWYGRDDLRAAITGGDLLMPPSQSISRWLIETWYGGPLPRAPRQAGAF